MNTHNIFHGEIRKVTVLLWWKNNKTALLLLEIDSSDSSEQ